MEKQSYLGLKVSDLITVKENVKSYEYDRTERSLKRAAFSELLGLTVEHGCDGKLVMFTPDETTEILSFPPYVMGNGRGHQFFVFFEKVVDGQRYRFGTDRSNVLKVKPKK